MKKEIYRSFDVLEVGGDRTGYIVYQTPNWYQIEWKSIEPEVSERKFRIKKPIDWTDREPPPIRLRNAASKPERLHQLMFKLKPLKHSRVFVKALTRNFKRS